MADFERGTAEFGEKNVERPGADISLDDEKVENEQHNFGGATLEMNGVAEGSDSVPDVAFQFSGPASYRNVPSSAEGADEFSRDRPGSTMSRKTTASTGSVTSMCPNRMETNYSRDLYFCRKDGSFENAVEKCKELFVKPELDGELRGAWLLTEIDHWDAEREKLVLLTDTSLLMLRYDFITSKVLWAKRVLLKTINQLTFGDLTYPEKSLMPSRQHGAVRISWGDMAQTSFGQRWNPWCSDMPFTTLAHHKLIYNENERETVTYNVDDFIDSLVGGINAALRLEAEGPTTVKVVEEPIPLQSYASLYSMVFNQSHLGFNRERGGVSF